MTEKAYLSYYGEHGIIPVRQDITDLPRHYARRRALYRHLAVHPTSFRNRSILEFGPGTGDNALFLASCAPELCVLVDGNPESVRAISEKLERGQLPRDRFELCTSDILEYSDARRFDIVLCEGVIPGQRDPEAFLAHVASFAAPEGIVVITTMSPESMLAEMCRRTLKPFFSTTISDWDRLVQELTAFFEPDLRSLSGMSRLHEDWVLDNILNPWPRRCVFTIPDAIDVLDSGFDLLGTSPHFVQDWRWYKAIPTHPMNWNDVARDEYHRWSPFLLDYRIQPQHELLGIAARVEAACRSAFDVQHTIWHEDSLEGISEFGDRLAEIGALIKNDLPETAEAICDFSRGLLGLSNGNRITDFGSFRTWFGRGQQYASFARKPHGICG